MMQQAGADALDLNVYFAATEMFETGEGVEQRVLKVAVLAGEIGRVADRHRRSSHLA